MLLLPLLPLVCRHMSLGIHSHPSDSEAAFLCNMNWTFTKDNETLFSLQSHTLHLSLSFHDVFSLLNVRGFFTKSVHKQTNEQLKVRKHGASSVENERQRQNQIEQSSRQNGRLKENRASECATKHVWMWMEICALYSAFENIPSSSSSFSVAVDFIWNVWFFFSRQFLFHSQWIKREFFTMKRNMAFRCCWAGQNCSFDTDTYILLTRTHKMQHNRNIFGITLCSVFSEARQSEMGY